MDRSPPCQTAPARATPADRILTDVKRALLLALLLALALAGGGNAAAASRPHVMAVHFVADVDPVTQQWLNDKIGDAERGGYDAVVIVLDTPGGLSESMRKIVKRELTAKLPVIVYVAPPGARAASAGVWIGQAADVLAM